MQIVYPLCAVKDNFNKVPQIKLTIADTITSQIVHTTRTQNITLIIIHRNVVAKLRLNWNSLIVLQKNVKVKSKGKWEAPYVKMRQ